MPLPRVLTAAVGLPLLLGLIHLGSLPFALFTVGAAFLALYEYGLALWLGGRPVQRWATAAGGTLLCLALALQPPAAAPRAWVPPVGLALAGLLLWVMLREIASERHSLERASLSLFGAVFVGWSLGHLALLRALKPHGEAFTLFLFGVIWATDIAAYAAGTAFGSRRLAPAVSPGKTWEGAAAGTAAALAAALALRLLLLRGALGAGGAAGLGLLIGVLGQASDLAESVIKRSAGVKDSSSLLPGHGGVLDRFDSFLLAAPALYYALAWRLG